MSDSYVAKILNLEYERFNLNIQTLSTGDIVINLTPYILQLPTDTINPQDDELTNFVNRSIIKVPSNYNIGGIIINSNTIPNRWIDFFIGELPTLAEYIIVKPSILTILNNIVDFCDLEMHKFVTYGEVGNLQGYHKPDEKLVMSFSSFD